MEMRRLGGSFWEGGLAAVEKGVRVADEETLEAEEEEWEREVVGTLEGLRSVGVEDGYVIFAKLNRGGLLTVTFSGHLRIIHFTFRSCISYWTEQAPCWKSLRRGCRMGCILNRHRSTLFLLIAPAVMLTTVTPQICSSMPILRTSMFVPPDD